MNARALFLVPFLTAVYLGLGLGIWQLADGGPRVQWAGVVIGAAPYGVWFARLMLKRFSTSAAGLPVEVGAAWLGVAVAAVGLGTETPAPAALVTALAVAIGITAYARWYSVLDRSGSKLAVGEVLPRFTLTDLDGAPVSSEELHGSLLLFFRGNWCPLCMTQINEIADQYKRLHERGVQVVLISGQSESDTRSLADSFAVPMRHLHDPGLVTARQLGLFHERAAALGVETLYSAENDAYLPTVALVDRRGRVIWLDETDNYRVRPEPETFLAEVDKAGPDAFLARGPAVDSAAS